LPELSSEKENFDELQLQFLGADNSTFIHVDPDTDTTAD
jgi:hypothetical protein